LLSLQSAFDRQAQTFGPPTQAPPEHRSWLVQASLSLHDAVLLFWTQTAWGVPGF